jgi:hypothetical protein
MVEIGIGDCSRALRLISLAAKCLGGPVAYCGIDLFEAAPKGKTVLKYKDAYCKLNIANCKTKLVPGEPAMALSTCANSLTNTNLIVVSNQFDTAALAPMWMYVPRMLAADAKIFMQSDDGAYDPLSLRELMSLADQATEMRRKSA